MRKILIIGLITTNLLFANNYIVKYEDTVIGRIDDLQTINDNYIKIKIENFFMKMKNLGKDYLIIYKDNKPVIKKIDENCNFKLDKNNYITLIKSNIKEETNIKNKEVELTIKNRVVEYFKDFKNNISIQLKKIDPKTFEINKKDILGNI